MVVQVRGAENPFEFLEQLEWSANTYGLDLDMNPRAMPELLKRRAGGSGQATKSELQRVVQRLHDRHADDGEAT